MMHFVKSATELSAESLDMWGDRLGSRKLSRQIASIERFNDRVMGQVFAADPNMADLGGAQNPGQVAGHPGASHSAAGNHQMAASAAARTTGPTQAELSEQDLLAAQAIRNDSTGFARICGIVVYGDVFRKNISNADFADFKRHFSQNDLRIGCMLRQEHKQFADSQVEMSRLGELTSIAGNHCVATWLTSLPANLVRELAMIGIHASAFETNDQIGLQDDHCVRIVRGVASHVTAH